MLNVYNRVHRWIALFNSKCVHVGGVHNDLSAYVHLCNLSYKQLDCSIGTTLYKPKVI